METSRQRLSIPLVGAAVALAAGGLFAWSMVARHKDETPPPPPASKGGLIIDPSMPEEAHLDPARRLRCFVDGQMVGEMTLAACAQRNGVATDALDVGVDASGALAAAGQAGTSLAPLPPPVQPAAPAVQPAAAPAAACWRYAEGQWRKMPSDVSLNGCVQALYAGRCERPGSAAYGRWGQQTLRLVPGKVEISSDDHSFRTLVDQGAGCAVPAVG